MPARFDCVGLIGWSLSENLEPSNSGAPTDHSLGPIAATRERQADFQPERSQ